jgi:hypothetical protein
MKPFLVQSRTLPRAARAFWSRETVWGPAVVLSLVALTGCYHATGIERPPLIAEEVPISLTDKVGGYKASASPGDYYLGSDNVNLAVEGTPFESGFNAGALGGSIIDIGDVVLDHNYLRVATPSDRLERLAPVANQDPDLPLVFSSFQVENASNLSTITMRGGLYDPHHKVAGSDGWDSLDRVSGVNVTHSVSLANLQSYFTLQTTLTNNSSGKLGLYNLGDLLFQRGGGYKLNIPAGRDHAGNLLNNWGVDIPASGPGTTFGTPHDTVEATMVALMGNEPGGDLDYHCSLGILPVSDDKAVITSDPQPAFTDSRPMATSRLVVGSQPREAGLTLDPGQSISYTRQIYVVGGKSTAYGSGYYLQNLGQANEAVGVFNLMAMQRYTLRAMEFGTVLFYVDGTAQRGGALPTEVRIERYLGSVDPFQDPANPSADENFANYLADGALSGRWELERTEWFEPEESSTAYTHSPGYLGVLLPAGDDTHPSYYRIAFRNREYPVPTAPAWIYLSKTSIQNMDQPLPLCIKSGTAFQVIPASNLCPEYDQVVTGGQIVGGRMIGGTMVDRLFASASVSARSSSDTGSSSGWQPMRISVTGELDENGQQTADPVFNRVRTLGGYFNSVLRSKDFTSTNLGVNGFLGGNQAFGSHLNTGFWLPRGAYTFYGARGPLSALSTQNLEVDPKKPNMNFQFIVFQDPLPDGWTSFDIPGPSQITTGGYLPIEKLSSALAEGVQVIGNTEMDCLTSGTALQDDFRTEFEYYGSTNAQRAAVQLDPFVISARSSRLNEFGAVTALFTPEPRNERNGGARDSSAWTLADFLLQAEGQFNVVHRPRGPEGLFTLKAFTPGVVSNSNSWWNAQGNLSFGLTHGQFDAIELLRGESWDASNPDAWFTEFKTLRTDWFGIISQQAPTAFTKALGLSAGLYSQDTPVGLARTYVKAQGFTYDFTDGFNQSNLSPFLTALKNGAVVASTGPLLDVTVKGSSEQVAGPGELLSGSQTEVVLTVNLWMTDWMPVDELRVVVNGVVTNLDMNQLTVADDDWRHLTATYTVPMPASGDAWVVVEAGVPLNTLGVYQPGTAWNRFMKGIYPIALTNPIFVDVNGGGYTPPGL